MPAIASPFMWFRLTLVWLGCVSIAIAEVDPNTGLFKADAHDIVSANCLACHSSRLITQSNMTRDQWLDVIRYMQKNHNLWPLAQQEAVILDYLAQHYGPETVTQRRRKNLPYASR